ncbi:MAG: Xaa-Pro peptidase family protein [Candidatus Aenigmatarchaeota archaeon]
MSELRKRLMRLTPLKKKCCGILLYNAGRWANPTFFWLSNCTVSGWLWVPFRGRPRLFTRETYKAELRGTWAKVEYVSKTNDILSAVPTSNVGLDALHTPAFLFSKIKNKVRGTNVARHLEAARAVKTPYEIKQIRKACAVACDIFTKIRLPYRGSEAQLRADLDWEIQSRGLEPAFSTIVASAKNIVSPHHAPSLSPATKPLLIDLGVRFNGYCSDTTRTYGSKYQPIVRKVFEAVESLLKPGTCAADIDAEARKALGAHAKHFITALGHGIGIAVHEPPNIRADSKELLQPGNVLTIEPGIYVGGGIRHENMYLIGPKGAENLTNF